MAKGQERSGLGRMRSFVSRRAEAGWLVAYSIGAFGMGSVERSGCVISQSNTEGSAVNESCAQCRFFQESSKYGGSCRRYPPQFYSNWDGENQRPVLDIGYPFMAHEQWCGEFAHSAEGK